MKRTIEAKNREIRQLKQEISRQSIQANELQSFQKSRDFKMGEIDRTGFNRSFVDDSMSSDEVKKIPSVDLTMPVNKRQDVEEKVSVKEALPSYEIKDEPSQLDSSDTHEYTEVISIAGIPEKVDSEIYVVFSSHFNKDLKAYDVENLRVSFSSFEVSSDEIVFELRKSIAHQVSQVIFFVYL